MFCSGPHIQWIKIKIQKISRFCCPFCSGSSVPVNHKRLALGDDELLVKTFFVNKSYFQEAQKELVCKAHGTLNRIKNKMFVWKLCHLNETVVKQKNMASWIGFSFFFFFCLISLRFLLFFFLWSLISLLPNLPFSFSLQKDFFYTHFSDFKCTLHIFGRLTFLITL